MEMMGFLHITDLSSQSQQPFSAIPRDGSSRYFSRSNASQVLV